MTEDRLDDMYDLIMYLNSECETYCNEYRIEERLIMNKCLKILRHKYLKEKGQYD